MHPSPHLSDFHPARSQAAEEPYVLGGLKRFWISPADAEDPFSQRLRSYLRALLCADQHESPVPHFEEVPVYLGLLSPDELLVWQEKQKSMRKRQRPALQAVADADEWEVPDVEPKRAAKAPRTGGKRKAKPKPLIASEATEAAVLSNEATDGHEPSAPVLTDEPYDELQHGAGFADQGYESMDEQAVADEVLQQARARPCEEVTPRLPLDPAGPPGTSGKVKDDGRPGSSSSSFQFE